MKGVGVSPAFPHRCPTARCFQRIRCYEIMLQFIISPSSFCHLTKDIISFHLCYLINLLLHCTELVGYTLTHNSLVLNVSYFLCSLEKTYFTITCISDNDLHNLVILGVSYEKSSCCHNTSVYTPLKIKCEFFTETVSELKMTN